MTRVAFTLPLMVGMIVTKLSFSSRGGNLFFGLGQRDAQ
jgi:hypothetical protein